MIDAEPLIDDEVLVYELLSRDLAAQDEIDDVTVTAAVDVDEDDPLSLPFVTFTLSGEGQDANAGGSWNSTLVVSTVAEGFDAAKALARLTYRLVHAWSDPATSRIAGIGGVVEVTDQSKPSRQPAARVDSRWLVQYDGIYGLLLRS